MVPFDGLRVRHLGARGRRLMTTRCVTCDVDVAETEPLALFAQSVQVVQTVETQWACHRHKHVEGLALQEHSPLNSRWHPSAPTSRIPNNFSIFFESVF
jgi:hypothetical protein